MTFNLWVFISQSGHSFQTFHKHGQIYFLFWTSPILTDYNTSATPRRDSAEVLRKFCNLFVTLYSSTLLHFYAFKKRKYFYAEVKGSEPKSKLLVMSYHETFIYVCKSWRHTDRVTMYNLVYRSWMSHISTSKPCMQLVQGVSIP